MGARTTQLLSSCSGRHQTPPKLSSLINKRIPISATFTTRHQTMSTQLTVKAQLGLVGISTRCQSCRGIASGGFLVLRQISRWSHTTTTFSPVHNVAPSRPYSFSAGQWRVERAGRTTFSTSSSRRIPHGENSPAAAGEAQAGGKAGKNEMNGISLLGRKQRLTDSQHTLSG